MSFVYKGDVPFFAFGPIDPESVEAGFHSLRIVNSTQFLPSAQAIQNATLVDVTDGVELVVNFSFFLSPRLVATGEQITELVLDVVESQISRGDGFENSSYRIQVDGPTVLTAEPFSWQGYQALLNGFGDPVERGVRLDNIDAFQFLGQIGDRVLQGSAEAREERAERIAYVYEAGLDRDGEIDEGGLNFWIDAAGGGLTDRQIAQAFLDSPEFEASFGDPDTLSDFDFVTVLYENVLDRAADDPGRAFWISVLEQPEVGRNELLLSFADSGENVAASPAVQTLTETESGIWEFIA